MRRRLVSILLTIAMVATVGTYFISTGEVRADEFPAKFLMDAGTLPDGKIAVLFIKGGSIYEDKVSGGSLYYGVYDPSNNGWIEESVGAEAPSASQATMALNGDIAHVAYINSDKDIAYTYKTSNGWADESIIDSNNFNGKQGTLYAPDIAVDNNGKAHIIYMDTDGALNDTARLDDIVYATNDSGEFVKTLIQNCTGDSDYRCSAKTPHISFNENGYVISYFYSTWDSSTGYFSQLVTPSGHAVLNEDWRQQIVYDALGYGSDAWTFFYSTNSSAYKFGKFGYSNGDYIITDIISIPHANNPAAATMDANGNLYFAGINGTSAVFYQAGNLTDCTTTTGRYGNHSKVATVLAGNDQYLLYTGSDTDKSLVIAKFDGSELTEFLVPNATPEATPEAVFTPNGFDSGVLSNVVSGMKYSLDKGSTWENITDASVEITCNVDPENDIWVYQPSTDPLKTDSEKQIIDIVRSDTPDDLQYDQPSVINGKGTIYTDNTMEYKLDSDDSYTSCTGTLENVEPGTYYVRIKATNELLASTDYEIVIKEFVPDKEATPEATFSAESYDYGTLKNLDYGQYYRVRRTGDEDWTFTNGSNELLTDLDAGDVIEVYKPGNGTTTIDSDVQEIELTRAETPNLVATQPDHINGTGTIPTTDMHMSSVNGVDYYFCTGPMDSLMPATFYIREKAHGTVLASDPQTIVIKAFDPEVKTTPSVTFEATGNQSGNFTISNYESSMKYNLDNEGWKDVPSATFTISSGLTEGSEIVFVNKGDNYVSVDSDPFEMTLHRMPRPELEIEGPDENGKLSMATDSSYEYSNNASTYTDCTGPLELISGKMYFIRKKAQGDKLTSNYQSFVAPAVYTVTFDPNNGDETTTVYVKSGDKVAKPADPSREGWDFIDWVTSNGNSFNFNAEVTSDASLTAIYYSTIALGVYNKSNTSDTACGLVDIAAADPNCSHNDKNFINFTIPDGEITLTAKPKEGYKFVGWYEGTIGSNYYVNAPTDTLLSTDNPYTFEAQPQKICAVFECAGHQWETKVCKATFDEPGCVYQVCSVCGTEETLVPLPQVTKVSLAATSYTYTGKAIQPKVTVANASEELSSDYYDVKYTNNVEVGTAKVTVTLKGEYYEGSKTLTFTIKAKPATPTPTKKPATPTPTKEPTKTPTKAPAKPTATATPKPAKNSLKRAKVVFQYSDYEYREGTDKIKPAINVTIDGTKLKGKTDFTGDLKNNDRPGTASITLNAVKGGKYVDSVTYDFNIVAVVVCGKTLDLSKISAWKGAKFAISDKTIATVDKSGKITGVQAGAATVTVTLKDGKKEKFSVRVLYKDVTSIDDFWYEPTNALTAMGIVKGYDKQTNFKPANECSRAQMVTFLWRLAGEPAPKAKTTSFKDIKSSDYFYKPVLWAVEKGITTGVSKEKFDPQGICTRAQTVTFLWRMAGKPEPKSKTCKFSDVKEKDYFYKATIWASDKKIVAGYDDGTFKPQGKCLRRQMVTFLYKYNNNVGVKK